MSIIRWNNTLNTRIESIDTQHKKLVELINTFYENVNRQSSKELMFNLIGSLKDYTVYHFSTEEHYMKKFGFPGYNAHKAEHDKFVEKVLQLEEKFNSSKMILTLEVTFFIKDWVSKHIMETDQQYSDFLIKNGVK